MAESTAIQAGIGGDKIQRKNRQRQAKTKSESREPMIIHLNQYSSRDHQISNQKPCGSTAPLGAPINVPSHRTFNLWSRISFIGGDSPKSHSATSCPNEISKAAQRKSRVLQSTVMRTSVIITQAANSATLRFTSSNKRK